MFCQVMKWLLKPYCLALLSKQLSTPWVSETKAAFSVISLTFSPQICAPLRETGSEFRRQIINFSYDLYKDVHSILNTCKKFLTQDFTVFP